MSVHRQEPSRSGTNCFLRGAESSRGRHPPKLSDPLPTIYHVILMSNVLTATSIVAQQSTDELLRVVVQNEGSSIWANLAFWGLLVPVALALLAAYFNSYENRKQAAFRHRSDLTQRYGDALAAAMAWQEVPYRIARRPSDDTAIVAALVEHIHRLQEQIQHHRRWLGFESPIVGDSYAALVDEVKAQADNAIKEAWRGKPAVEARDQVLASPPPAIDVAAQCEAFFTAAQEHINKITAVRKLPSRRKPEKRK